MTDVDAVLDALAGRRLCVIGDLLLDVYVSGRVERISPEAPVPVVIHETTDYRASGAGTAAQTAAGLAASVVLVGVTGADEDGEQAAALMREFGVEMRVVRDPGRPTPRKTRVVVQGQQLLRIDREQTDDLSADVAADVVALVSEVVAGADAVLVSDYAKGVCTEGVVQAVVTAASLRGVPVVVDPKRASPKWYQGATAVTPNAREFEAFAGQLGCAGEPVEAVARQLRDVGGFEWAVVTRAEKGMTVVGSGPSFDVPAYAAASEVVDVGGAGDAVAAVLALALGAGVPMDAAAVTASLAAGFAIRQWEHKRVTREQVLAAADRFGLRQG